MSQSSDSQSASASASQSDDDSSQASASESSRRSKNSSRSRSRSRRKRPRQTQETPLPRAETVAFLPQEVLKQGSKLASNAVPRFPPSLCFMKDRKQWDSVWPVLSKTLTSGPDISKSDLARPEGQAAQIRFLEQTRIHLIKLTTSIGEFIQTLLNGASTLPPAFLNSDVVEVGWLSFVTDLLNFLEHLQSMVTCFHAALDKGESNPSYFIVQVVAETFVEICYTRIQPWITGTFRQWNERRKDDAIGVGSDGFWSQDIRVATLILLCQMTVIWNKNIIGFVRKHMAHEVAPDSAALKDADMLSQMNNMTLREWGVYYDALVDRAFARSGLGGDAKNDEQAMDAVDTTAETALTMCDVIFTWFSNPSCSGTPIRTLPHKKYDNAADPSAINAHQQLSFIPQSSLSDLQTHDRFVIPRADRLWNMPTARGIDLDKPFSRYCFADVYRLMNWIKDQQFALNWNPLLEWLTCCVLWGAVSRLEGDPQMAREGGVASGLSWDSLTDAEIEDNLFVAAPYDSTGFRVRVNSTILAEMERQFGFWIGTTELSYRFAQTTRPDALSTRVRVFFPDLGAVSLDLDTEEDPDVADAVSVLTREESRTMCQLILQEYAQARKMNQYRDLLNEKLITATLGYFVMPRVLETHIERESKVASRNFLDLLRIYRKTDCNSLMYCVHHPHAPIFMLVYNTCGPEDALAIYRILFDGIPDVPGLSDNGSGGATKSSLPAAAGGGGDDDDEISALPPLVDKPQGFVALPSGHNTRSKETALIERISRQALVTGPMIPDRIKCDAYPRMVSYFHQQILDAVSMKNAFTHLLGSAEIMRRLNSSSSPASGAAESLQRKMFVGKLMEAAYGACKLEMEDAAANGISADVAFDAQHIPKLTQRVATAIDKTLKQLKSIETTGSGGAGDGDGGGGGDDEEALQSLRDFVVEVPVGSAAALARRNAAAAAAAAEEKPQTSNFKTNVATIHYSIRSLGLPDVIERRGYRHRLRYALDPVGYSEAFFAGNKRKAPSTSVDSMTGQVEFRAETDEPHLWSLGTEHWVYIPRKLLVRTRNYIQALKVYTKYCANHGLWHLVDPISKDAFVSSELLTAMEAGISGSSIVLNDEQTAVFNEILSRRKGAYFLSAPGGCGKSTLVKKLLSHLPRGEVMLTATTNQAASNYASGRTIHKALRLMDSDVDWIKEISAPVSNAGLNPVQRAICPWFCINNNLRFIVVDEVSFMDQELFDRFIWRLCVASLRIRKNALPKVEFPGLQDQLNTYKFAQMVANLPSARSSLSGPAVSEDSGAGPNRTSEDRRAYYSGLLGGGGGGNRPTQSSAASRKHERDSVRWYLTGAFWRDELAPYLEDDNLWNLFMPTLVLVGDPMQLEPVAKPGSKATPCWRSKIWQAMNPKILQLRKNMRALQDAEFADFLLKLRIGVLDEEKALRRIRTAPISAFVAPPKNAAESARFPVILVGTNDFATRINTARYKALSFNRPFCFTSRAHDYVSPEKEATFRGNMDWYRKDLDDALPASVDICVGLHVILVRNIDADAGLVKGRKGIIMGILTLENDGYFRQDTSKWLTTFSDFVDYVRAKERPYGLHVHDFAENVDAATSHLGSPMQRFMEFTKRTLKARKEGSLNTLPDPVFCTPKNTGFDRLGEMHAGIALVIAFESCAEPILVAPSVFSCDEFSYNSLMESVTADPIVIRKQWPVILGYAITCHRSQGMTLHRVHLHNSGNGSNFGDNSTYLAVSRAVSFDALSVTAPLTRENVKYNKSTVEFFKLDAELAAAVTEPV